MKWPLNSNTTFLFLKYFKILITPELATIQYIEEVLTEDIRELGIDEFSFLFAQNDVLDTGASIQIQGKV
jgi:hypothetical protein